MLFTKSWRDTTDPLSEKSFLKLVDISKHSRWVPTVVLHQGTKIASILFSILFRSSLHPNIWFLFVLNCSCCDLRRTLHGDMKWQFQYPWTIYPFVCYFTDCNVNRKKKTFEITAWWLEKQSQQTWLERAISFSWLLQAKC